MTNTLTVPGAEPTLWLGGTTACLLLHGFSSGPDEMEFLARDLSNRGYTVLTLRLAGHASTPQDLARTRWTDWLLSIEDGLNLVRNISERTVLIGQSMGGMAALAAAASLQPVAGVVALSTPYFGFPALQVFLARLMGALGMIAYEQGVREHPDLGPRRQAGYPAYARYPVRTVVELDGLRQAMLKAMPQVKVPALVIQSHQDMGGGDDLEHIYNALGSAWKEKLWLDGFDHSIVRDDKRRVVFEAVAEFISKLEAKN